MKVIKILTQILITLLFLCSLFAWYNNDRIEAIYMLLLAISGDINLLTWKK